MSERTTHQKAYLEAKAERFFEHDSLLSDSDDSLLPTRSTRRTKKSTRRSATQIDSKNSARKPVSKREATTETLQSTRKPTSRSKSRPPKEKSLPKQKSPRGPDGPGNVSTLKDNYTLRLKINDLSKTLQKRNKQIKRLYDNIYSEKEQIRQLTLKANDISKKNYLIEEFEEKINAMRDNELNLVQELSEQQRVAKDALTKLYEFQEDSMKETESIKKYYRDFYTQQANEVKEQLEERMNLIAKEKENLLSTIKNIDAVKEIERNNQISALTNEIGQLKEQLSVKQIEIENLKHENRDLKSKLKDQEDSSGYEAIMLKARIDDLNRQSQALKHSEEEHVLRDASEKMKLHRKIEGLEKEVIEKDKSIRAKDKEYRDQLELINEKVVSLQREIKKIGEYEVKIDTLEKELSLKGNELELAKQYFKEKMALRKKVQNDQKNEWSEIYNELLDEIKSLKLEINSLVIENKRLVRPFNNFDYV